MTAGRLQAIGLAAAGLCGITGIVYAITVDTAAVSVSNIGLGPPASVVLTLGLLGAALLATVATWQAGARGRDIPLAMMAGLSAVYVFANVAGMTIIGLTRESTSVIKAGTGMRIVLWAGLFVGSGLVGATLLEILRAQRARSETVPPGR